MDHPPAGPLWHADGAVTFRVWAPACSSLALRWLDQAAPESVAESLPMSRDDTGMFVLHVEPDDARPLAGRRYGFQLPTGTVRPDPASRFQPEGVHGPSQLIDPTLYRWTDAAWRGVPKASMILYELHIGTWTAAGTYLAAIERLGELVTLGINAIEIMPVVETSGDRNWGYDGVNLFAPRNAYGTPDELKQFIDAAHRHGIAVILDVVYNHFGPEGNYLHEFGGYVSQKHHTAWGDAPNFDEAPALPMRDFIVSNAVYWMDEFHCDGLRLDAVHCMADDSPRHVVNEIGAATAKLRSSLDRELHLIAESNVYDPELLLPLEAGGHGFDAIWCDDFLHSVNAVLCPEQQMSNRQYRPRTDLDTTLRRGFVFQDSLRSKRRRVPPEEPAPEVALESLIFSIQNHDFIGNHPLGQRIHQATSRDAQRTAAALMLLYPAMPMLFMGEEFAAESPFLFFTDFSDAELRLGVEQGRQAEYPQHDWGDSDSPLLRIAFQKSKLSAVPSGDAAMLEWYRALIGLRKDWQASGLLSFANMRAGWDEHLGGPRLVFEDASQKAQLIARMHPPGAAIERVQVTSSGTVLLYQHAELVDSQQSLWELSEYAVVVQHQFKTSIEQE